MFIQVSAVPEAMQACHSVLCNTDNTIQRMLLLTEPWLTSSHVKFSFEGNKSPLHEWTWQFDLWVYPAPGSSRVLKRSFDYPRGRYSQTTSCILKEISFGKITGFKSCATSPMGCDTDMIAMLFPQMLQCCNWFGFFFSLKVWVGEQGVIAWNNVNLWEVRCTQGHLKEGRKPSTSI